MKVLVFQTNIDTQHSVEVISPLFNNHKGIIDWSVDTEDIDKVLRVESTEHLNESDIINLMIGQGFYCGGLMS
jgi:hypothetical protein